MTCTAPVTEINWIKISIIPALMKIAPLVWEDRYLQKNHDSKFKIKTDHFILKGGGRNKEL